MSWTETRIETLKQLWADGRSCSQIATELGDVTRNGVIGKIHRLGLSGRNQGQNDRAPRKVRQRKAKRNGITFGIPHALIPINPTPLTTSVDDFAIPIGQRRTLMELNSVMCRWPIGDPQTPEFFFCGGHAEPGKPYCIGHQRRAYYA